MDTEHQPLAPKELRRWAPTEEHQLISLRDTQHKSFEEIATMLNRTTAAVHKRYTTIKQRHHSSIIDWTWALDASIISGRRRGQGIPEIASSLDIPKEAVGERWQALQKNGSVPEDVLALWRRKEDVVFTQEEDEAILKLWIRCKDDEEIVRSLKFRGKSQADVRARRKELVRSSPMYLKLLGVGQGKENEVDALERALGKPKYAWMN